MTGPEHYAAAEAYLEAAKNTDPVWSDDSHRAFQVAAAQAHATLALTAATAMRVYPVLTSSEPVSVDDWREVIACVFEVSADPADDNGSGS